MIHLSLKLGTGGLTLGFDGATALFLGAIGFGLRLGNRFAVEAVNLLFGFGDHGLSGLSGTLQLFGQFGFELLKKQVVVIETSICYVKRLLI